MKSKVLWNMVEDIRIKFKKLDMVLSVRPEGSLNEVETNLKGALKKSFIRREKKYIDPSSSSSLHFDYLQGERWGSGLIAGANRSSLVTSNSLPFVVSSSKNHHERWGSGLFRLIVLVGMSTSVIAYGMTAELTYSRASQAAQKGDWHTAQEKMSSLLVDAPDRADIAYDCGVVAYKKQEFEKAEAYFKKVIESKNASAHLKKQAWFNRGNSHVALKQLPEAIKDYQEVLKLDPHDKAAQHNMKKVQEMLQQQQNKDQQKDQDKNQKQDQDKKQDQQQQGNDQQKQDQQKGDKKDQQQGNQNKDQQGNDTSSGQDLKKDKNKDAQHGTEKNKDGKKQDDQQSGDEKKEDQSGGSEKQEEEKADGQQEGDQKDEAGDGSEGQGSDKQQEQIGDNHASTPEENKSGKQLKPTQAGEKEQEMQQGEVVDYRKEEQKKLEQSLSPQDQWMARVLERSDKRDEQINKKMIKSTIDKNMAGKHGQNNW